MLAHTVFYSQCPDAGKVLWQSFNDKNQLTWNGNGLEVGWCANKRNLNPLLEWNIATIATSGYQISKSNECYKK